MDSELLTFLLKFIEYFPDYLSALSRTLLRFFGQPLSKQLYTKYNVFLQYIVDYTVVKKPFEGEARI